VTSELHLGDCLDVMQGIPDGSVDLILCDLPYGITDCKWDSVIPFEPLWDAYKRILTERGAVVLTASQPFTTDLINSNRVWFKYCSVWEKTRSMGFVHAKNKPLKIHEDIVVFSPGTTVHSAQSKTRMTYNPQMQEGKPYSRVHRQDPRGDKWGGEGRASYAGNVCTNDGKRYPTSVLKFANPNNSTIHPTQKPVPLFEYLIRTYSNEGDTVLDNCMGSGTTGVACVNTGRNFIGIEKDPEFFQIAQKRIQEAQNSYIVDLFMTGKEAEL
jgi:site-specific DNA-methyltransferase (adenine-specific)